MPYSEILDREISREAFLPHAKYPRPASFDSAEEFSLEHLLELRELVDAEDPEVKDMYPSIRA